MNHVGQLVCSFHPYFTLMTCSEWNQPRDEVEQDLLITSHLHISHITSVMLEWYLDLMLLSMARKCCSTYFGQPTSAPCRSAWRIGQGDVPLATTTTMPTGSPDTRLEGPWPRAGVWLGCFSIPQVIPHRGKTGPTALQHIWRTAMEPTQNKNPLLTMHGNTWLICYPDHFDFFFLSSLEKT